MTDDTVIPAVAGDLGMPGAPVIPAAPPMSMQEAASRKEAFLSDKVKTTALMNGDVGATNEWRLITQNLWQPPQFTQPRDEVTEHLQKSSGYSLRPEVLEEFKQNLPISPDEYELAQQRLESRKQDPEWLAKYMRGDLETKREVALINSILSRPIRTVTQGGNEGAQS